MKHLKQRKPWPSLPAGLEANEKVLNGSCQELLLSTQKQHGGKSRWLHQGQQHWEGKPQAKSTATSGEGEGPGLTQAIHLTGQIRPWYTPPGLCLTHKYT